jgi:hypothetical protein
VGGGSGGTGAGGSSGAGTGGTVGVAGAGGGVRRQRGLGRRSGFGRQRHLRSRHHDHHLGHGVPNLRTDLHGGHLDCGWPRSGPRGVHAARSVDAFCRVR